MARFQHRHNAKILETDDPAEIDRYAGYSNYQRVDDEPEASAEPAKKTSVKRPREVARP